jgi:hypothetical protein
MGSAGERSLTDPQFFQAILDEQRNVHERSPCAVLPKG